MIHLSEIIRHKDGEMHKLGNFPIIEETHESIEEELEREIKEEIWSTSSIREMFCEDVYCNFKREEAIFLQNRYIGQKMYRKNGIADFRICDKLILLSQIFSVLFL